MSIRIALASIVTAFEEQCVGTRMRDPKAFMATLEDAVLNHQFPMSGQGYIQLNCLDAVYSGVARRDKLKIDDYVVRSWRGEVGLFACRKMAIEVEQLAAIVYTRVAYILDPEVSIEEAERIGSAPFVLVAILATAGYDGKVPLSSHRFVKNLAGGNTAYGSMPAEALIEEAKRIVEYEREFVTVAD